jgi:predicted nucleotidyltransferase component of viral defense system
MADPIMNRLTRTDFLALAEMQDRFIDMIYSFDKDFVLHGGTAIWRCYGGNRFSFDIDGYMRSRKEFDLLRNNITWEMAKKGIRLKNIWTMETGGLFIYIPVMDAIDLKVELVKAKQKINPIRVNYERVDGSLFSVLTLTAEDFILEKINAYESRRYIRDLYDIYQLISKVENQNRIKRKLRRFIDAINPPINEHELDPIIISGVTPTVKDMVKYIDGRIK